MKSVQFLVIFFSLISCFETAHAASRSGGGGGGSAGGKDWYVNFDLAPVLNDANDSIRGGEGGGNLQGEGGVATARTLGYDLKSTFGYAFNSMWLVGLSYDMYSTSTKRDAVPLGDSARDSSTSIKEYGPTVGVLYNGWHASLTYLLSSQFKYKDRQTDSTGAVTSDINTTLKDGSGFIFNVGYSFQLVDWLDIGPSLVYRKVTYKKEDRYNALAPAIPGETFNDQSLATSAVQGNLAAFLSLTARF